LERDFSLPCLFRTVLSCQSPNSQVSPILQSTGREEFEIYSLPASSGGSIARKITA
jgi:hypothetical protein